MHSRHRYRGVVIGRGSRTYTKLTDRGVRPINLDRMEALLHPRPVQVTPAQRAALAQWAARHRVRG